MTSRPFPGLRKYAVYTGRATNWPMVAVTSVCALLIGLIGNDSRGATGDLMYLLPLLLVPIGVLAEVLTGSSVRTTAGPNGLTVRWGVFGWPQSTYRLDQIEHAEVVEIPWWRVSYGLWWTPKRTNCTVRRGPALRLSLHNKRTVTITVPDPAAAVAALHDASIVENPAAAER